MIQISRLQSGFLPSQTHNHFKAPKQGGRGGESRLPKIEEDSMAKLKRKVIVP